jgi:glutaredoxin-like YruB-family protein
MSVKVYSTPSCPYCKKVKSFLDEEELEYESYDVSKNQEKQQEMIDKSDQMGVPVIDIDGEIIVGFHKSKIEAALKS